MVELIEKQNIEKEEGFKSWEKYMKNYPIGNYFDFIDKLAGDKLC